MASSTLCQLLELLAPIAQLGVPLGKLNTPLLAGFTAFPALPRSRFLVYGSPSRQVCWLLPDPGRVTTWKSPSSKASRNRPLLTC